MKIVQNPGNGKYLCLDCAESWRVLEKDGNRWYDGGSRVATPKVVFSLPAEKDYGPFLLKTKLTNGKEYLVCYEGQWRKVTCKNGAFWASEYSFVPMTQVSEIVEFRPVQTGIL